MTRFIVALLLCLVTFSDAIMCRVELNFDDKPEDTSWELRGPGIKLVAKVDYDDYLPEKYAFKSATESFELQEGQSYYFLLTDYEQNGGTSFKLFAELPSGDVLLESAMAEEVAAGKAVNFVVPFIPVSTKLQ